MSMNYRAAEKILYSYPVNMMRRQEALIALMRIRGETDCHAQNYGGIKHEEGTPSDPPGDYVNRLLKAERDLAKYSGMIRPVKEVRRELMKSSDERAGIMLKVMERVYFENVGIKELACEMGMNERTLYRRREELVRLVMEERRKENA